MENADKHATFDDLVAVMAALRSPHGCPWDREQTLATIRDYFLEEVHEALEAIADNDPKALQEELGDVLFEVCFLARIAEEAGWFTIGDSIQSIHDKLIRRHPHVFGEEHVSEAKEVPGRWMQLKVQEAEKRKQEGEGRRSILDGVPRTLPPLLQALRISERAVAVGFEWNEVKGVLEKLDEEIGELREAIDRGESSARLADELGDVLFTLVNVGRKLGLHAHDALQGTLAKFRRRFGWLEEELARRGGKLGAAGIEVLESLWQEAKRRETHSV